MAARKKTVSKERADRPAGTRSTPKLTDAQRQVVEAYLCDPARRKVHAYLAVHPTTGYHSAATEACKLFKNPEFRAHLKQRQAEIAERLDVTPEKVLRELAAIAFSNASDYFDWGSDGVKLRPADELPAEMAAAVAEVSETTTQHGGTLRLKLHNKLAALEVLGKNLGLFRDKVEVEPGGTWAELLKVVHEHAAAEHQKQV